MPNLMQRGRVKGFRGIVGSFRGIPKRVYHPHIPKVAHVTKPIAISEVKAIQAIMGETSIPVIPVTVPKVGRTEFIRGYRSFAKFYGNHFSEYMELKKLITCGNLKLPKTTAIFNMGPAHGCPALKKGLCQAFVGRKLVCYARKAENDMRKFVLPFRKRQEAYWKGVTAEQFVLAFLTYNAIRVKPFDAIRLNESGDFWGQECVDKAEQIARYLREYGIRVYCYTARSDLDFSKVRVLKVMGSGWHNEHVRGEFKMIKKLEDKPKGYSICPMDCRICDKCMKGGMKIAVVKH